VSVAPPAPSGQRAAAAYAPTAPNEPVYQNPKIGEVRLRAHQDSDGRLYGPQTVYQVTEPGGWNLDAVDQGKAFIPAANIDVPPNMGSPYVVPAKDVPPLPADTPLIDTVQASEIILTGLMRHEDKDQAEAMARKAGGGRMAVFDEQAGWVLMPPGHSATAPQ
jgi:hypothetical protein